MGMRARVPEAGLLGAGNHRVAVKKRGGLSRLAWPTGTGLVSARPSACPLLLPCLERAEGTTRGLRARSCVPQKAGATRFPPPSPASAPQPRPRTYQVAVEGPRRGSACTPNLSSSPAAAAAAGQRPWAPGGSSEDFLDHEAAVTVRPVVGAALRAKRYARLPGRCIAAPGRSAASAAWGAGPRGVWAGPQLPAARRRRLMPLPAGQPGGGTGRGRGARGSAGPDRGYAPAPAAAPLAWSAPRHRPPRPASPPRPRPATPPLTPRPSPREARDRRVAGGGATRKADRPRQETQRSCAQEGSSRRARDTEPQGWEIEKERGERGSRARHRGPHKMRDGDVRMPGTPRRAQRATDRGAGGSSRP